MSMDALLLSAHFLPMTIGAVKLFAQSGLMLIGALTSSGQFRLKPMVEL